MARVITFSRTFPTYHPKTGQPTYFVEKLSKSLDFNKSKTMKHIISKELLPYFNFAIYNECEPKHHTIRIGNRWKVGDKFSPRIWKNKPYNSKMETIAPDIEIKKIFDFEMRYLPEEKEALILIDGRIIGDVELTELALNDGLNYTDLLDWFCYPRAFKGQIICWNENVNY